MDRQTILWSTSWYPLWLPELWPNNFGRNYCNRSLRVVKRYCLKFLSSMHWLPILKLNVGTDVGRQCGGSSLGWVSCDYKLSKRLIITCHQFHQSRPIIVPMWQSRTLWHHRSRMQLVKKARPVRNWARLVRILLHQQGRKKKNSTAAGYWGSNSQNATERAHAQEEKGCYSLVACKYTLKNELPRTFHNRK